MRHKEVLTTGEVARICHVAPRTVSKWFDTGKLRGYRIPGSRDRRIPLGQLLAFMRSHGLPLDALEGATTRVLIADADPAAARALAEELSRIDRYRVRTAGSDFEAGVAAGDFAPHVVLVDVSGGRLDAEGILRNLRGNPNLAATRVIAVAAGCTPDRRDALLKRGFDGILARPFQLHDVVGALEQATDLVR